MLKKSTRLMSVIFVAFLVSLFLASVVAAAPNTVDPNKLSSGTDRLLSWLSGIAVAAVPVAALIGIGFHAVMQMIGDQEPADIAHHKKRIKSIIKVAVIAQIPATIIGAILFFYV